MEPVLRADELRKRFGGLWAVDGVSMDVDAGQIVGLIGPNGSGKTSLVNLLNGVHRPDQGQVLLQGSDVTGHKPHRLSARGVMRTFQTARVFNTITVLENMLVPTLHRAKASNDYEEQAEGLLEFVGLADHRSLAASELSGGQQKLLEFARALITDPVVVLMDEPFAGVHPRIKETLLDRIRTRNAEGTAFVIVSHEIPDLLALARHVVWLDQGRVIAAGPPEVVREDDAVVTAYLGQPTPPGTSR
jgi:ABC-type branched-subunit amino acid transport system ATPase component